jgi:1-aminocyclopropane-1-carboxylate deaminase/D-cysteine desulfhydrase-like pyridoxal-dependent ACC family enzyme
VTVEARFEESSVRARLGTFPTPVEVYGALWVKRDDLNAAVCGGNKVRALEFLLGAVRPGDTVVTLGARGSTHILATAVHAGRLGARTVAYTWPQVMNPTALAVARAIADRCHRLIPSFHALAALARYEWEKRGWSALATGGQRVAIPHGDGGAIPGGQRDAAHDDQRSATPGGLRGAAFGGHRGATHFVPIGGTSPLGMLGHIEAGRELAQQIRDGLLPTPETVVVPMGTGGTAAGIAIGLGTEGIRTTVTAVRVVPWIATPPWRIPQLIRESGLRAVPVRVDHSAYGGAYGKPLARGRRAASEIGLPLDDTYMAKAAAVALAARGPTLLWVTFNAGALTSDLATCDRPAP